MAGNSVYSNLLLSPRKKRCPPSPDDTNTLTPKKLRTAPLTPPPTGTKKGDKQIETSLPTHLSRLLSIHTGIQHALTHALATSAASPSETGIVRNVLNHLSLTSYSGLSTTFSIDDLKRLCWLWEWDGKALPKEAKKGLDDEEDNPFLEDEPNTTPKDWTRSGMGFVITPATHNSGGRRVPAYGLGIEVELDIDKDVAGGIAAVAHWTAASRDRTRDVRRKLEKWAELNRDEETVPIIPLAGLPQLPTSATSLAITSRPFASPTKLKLNLPSTPSRSPSRSPTRSIDSSPRKSPIKGIFPPSLPVTPTINRLSRPTFPSTPSTSSSSPAITPRARTRTSGSDSEEPSTPTHNRGRAPATPSTARRQALYERIRERSLSPTKHAKRDVGGDIITKEQMHRLGQEEMRRRCLLGRLAGVAESVYMLFSSPSTTVTGTPSRKRRALPMSEVAPAIVKSSPVPISISEAQESLKMLSELCPFFLRPMAIAGAEWFEMPATSNSSSRAPSRDGGTHATMPSTPSKKGKTKVPVSPGSSKHIVENEEELVNRSPRRVKNEAGGLREVREVIRRELELQD